MSYENHGWRHRPRVLGGSDPGWNPGIFEVKVWPDEDVATFLSIDPMPTGDLFTIPILDPELHLTRLAFAAAWTPSGGGATIMIHNLTKAVDMLTTDLDDDGTPGTIEMGGSPPDRQVERLDIVVVRVTGAGTDSLGTSVSLKFLP